MMLNFQINIPNLLSSIYFSNLEQSIHFEDLFLIIVNQEKYLAWVRIRFIVGLNEALLSKYGIGKAKFYPRFT